MSHVDVIRAWRDEDYRLSLSADEQAQLPPSPIGALELTDAELDLAAGGIEAEKPCTCGCCTCSC